MSFIQRELDDIGEAMRTHEYDSPQYRELYAAQQALAWALEPSGIKSPLKTVVPDFVTAFQRSNPAPVPSSAEPIVN